LQFRSKQARIDDLLHLFTRTPRPALAGPIVLRGVVVAPPGDAPFLRKLRLQGSFEIEGAGFTAPRTQNKVDEFSTRARGEQVEEEEGKYPDRVQSSLGGKVMLRDGVAQLSEAWFRVPGAIARGSGTYNVITKRVDLKGPLSLDASLSEAAGGIKSILLKPLELFLKKNGSGGAVVPVTVTGTASQPSFRMHLREPK
jgi:hypothetical protein